MQLKATQKQEPEKWKRLFQYTQYCQHRKGFADTSVLAGCVRRVKGISEGAEGLVRHEVI